MGLKEDDDGLTKIKWGVPTGDIIIQIGDSKRIHSRLTQSYTEETEEEDTKEEIWWRVGLITPRPPLASTKKAPIPPTIISTKNFRGDTKIV